MNRQRTRLKRVDNGECIKKIRLRQMFTKEISQANIFLAGCGRGAMIKAVWQPKAGYVLAVDRDPNKLSYIRYHYPQVDARLDDFNCFQIWPDGVRFQVADFDPYGSPYDAIENFFQKPRWECPFVAIVTDGTPLWLGRGGFLPRQFRTEPAPRRLKDHCFRSTYFETVVWPWWQDIAKNNGLRLRRKVVWWKKGRMVAYYAIQLDL